MIVWLGFWSDGEWLFRFRALQAFVGDRTVGGGLDLGLGSTWRDFRQVRCCSFLSALASGAIVPPSGYQQEFFVMAKIKVHELRSKSKTELLNQVCDFSRISGRFFGAWYCIVVAGYAWSLRICLLSLTMCIEEWWDCFPRLGWDNLQMLFETM